ncbi:uncharacterized protein E0L32_010613 [Thyridium curvatum]|uniref:Uncharacterized protein n=1 Tax=Thyridium curvatum TaxID=1093900 RepID=A0A507AKZ1_9PEZI|nr:uncharacterized protein E0L32_010613 [Thyridium curvatum]TPX07717.1 hypothetical protein E0L32_010613 [Thyridium curvatum]
MAAASVSGEGRGDECDYLLNPLPASLRRAGITASTSATDGGDTPPLCLDPGIADFDSIEFLTAMPSMPLVLSAPERATWEQALGDTFAANPFLRHNVYALAAIQRYRTAPLPQRDLLVAACAHHAEASRLFRAAVVALNERNWLAAYMFGVSMTLFYFSVVEGGPAAAAADPAGAYFHDHLETFFALRSNAFLAVQLQPWFDRSPLLHVIAGNILRQTEPLDEACFDATEELRHAVEEGGGRTLPRRQADRAALRDAARALQEWAVDTQGHPHTWKHLIWWPGRVSREFVSLLVRGEPAALVALVNWCTAVARAPRRWYMDGWVLRTAGAAMYGLGPEWDPPLRWPRRELAARLAVSRYPPVDLLAGG